MSRDLSWMIRIFFVVVFALLITETGRASELPTLPNVTGSNAKAAIPPQDMAHSIGVYGDSLGDGVWSGLYYLLKSHPQDKLYRRAKAGTSLNSADFATWLNDFKTSLDTDQVTTAIIMFGANDQQSIRDENHKGYLFRSEGWTRVYSGRVAAILAETAKRHITTIWMGLPIMRSDDFNAGAIFLDDLYLKATKASGATFLPLIDAFKGPDGKYTTNVADAKGHLRLIRADDGIHFNSYGYELIALKVYPLIISPTVTSAAH